MKGKKTTVALAFLIVILLGVIGFKYSQMSGQSPIQALHKNSQVKNAAQSKSQSKEKADDNSEKPKENKNLEKKDNHNMLGRLYESHHANSPSKGYKL